MAHDEHHTPGEPPPVRDEAADSPLWLPAVGLTLLLLGAILLVWRTVDDGGPAFELTEEPAEGAEAAAAAEDAPAEADGDADAPGDAPADEHAGHGH